MTNAEFLNRLGSFWARYAEELSFGQFLDNFFDITEIDFRAYSNEEILELLAKRQSENYQVRAFKFKIGDRVRWANKALRPKMSIGQVIDIITDNGVQPRYKIEILKGTDTGLVVEPNTHWADTGGLKIAPEAPSEKLFRLWWSDADGCGSVLLGTYATALEAEKDLWTAFTECSELDGREDLFNGSISCEYGGYKNVFVVDDLTPL